MTAKIYFSKLKVIFIKLKTFGLLYSSSLWDQLLFFLRIPVAEKISFTQNKKTIIYLGGNLPARIARIIKWHKRFEDYCAVLVCHKDGFRDKYSNPSIDQVVLFRNHWHLKRILKNLKNVSLIHAFGPKSFYPAVAKKSTLGKKIPFVYDMQDVLVVYYGLNPPIRWYRNELSHEKYCLENADGLVSHSLEFQEALRRYDIKKKPANIFFPLCCDDDVAENKKGNFDPGNIHVVYVGEVAGSFRDSKQFATIQFHYIIEEFSKQKIHLHLYAAPGTLSDDINEYKNIEKQNQYLHIHETVHQSKLAHELSQYDFGLIPFFFKDTIHSWEKFKYSTSLKLFNYVEAGIPVISTKDIIFQSWIVERYGMGITINKTDIPNLKSIIGKTDYNLFLKNIEKNRPAISLSKHVPRLLKFYETIYRK
ncbi:MAG: glycosyltransferase [Bacteroidia bacterium]